MVAKLLMNSQRRIFFENTSKNIIPEELMNFNFKALILLLVKINDESNN